jgi:hypothetical protein
MSDEGMMTDDIQKCLQVVIQAVSKSETRADDIAKWCAAMLKKDRVGFICDKELRALQARSASPKSP